MATAERGTRVALLRKGGAESQKLAEFLAAFDDDEPAPVTCCPLTARDFRVWAVAQLLRLFEPYPKIWQVTLFFPEDDVPFGQLHTLDWPRIDMRERRRLERVVSPSLLVMGGKEVQPNYRRQTWQVHLHLFVADCTRQQLEALRAKYFKARKDTAGISRDGLMQVDEVPDRPRQMAYALKLIALRYPFKQTGAIRPKGKRLRLREHNEYLRYLAQHTPTELMFVMGAERNNQADFRRTRRNRRRKPLLQHG